MVIDTIWATGMSVDQKKDQESQDNKESRESQDALMTKGTIVDINRINIVAAIYKMKIIPNCIIIVAMIIEDIEEIVEMFVVDQKKEYKHLESDL